MKNPHESVAQTLENRQGKPLVTQEEMGSAMNEFKEPSIPLAERVNEKDSIVSSEEMRKAGAWRSW